MESDENELCWRRTGVAKDDYLCSPIQFDELMCGFQGDKAPFTYGFPDGVSLRYLS